MRITADIPLSWFIVMLTFCVALFVPRAEHSVAEAGERTVAPEAVDDALRLLSAAQQLFCAGHRERGKGVLRELVERFGDSRRGDIRCLVAEARSALAGP